MKSALKRSVLKPARVDVVEALAENAKFGRKSKSGGKSKPPPYYCPMCGGSVELNRDGGKSAFRHIGAGPFACDNLVQSGPFLVERAGGIAKTATLPLFLRRGPGETFFLAVGISLLDRAHLAELNSRPGRVFCLTLRNAVVASVPVEELTQCRESMFYLPVDTLFGPDMPVTVSVLEEDGASVPEKDWQMLWPSQTDWFVNTSVGCALFHYERGCPGEKVRNGDFILPNVEYLMMERQVGALTSLEPMLSKVRAGQKLSVIEVGAVPMKGLQDAHISRVKFPSQGSLNMEVTKYRKFLDILSGYLGVMLTEVSPDAVPIWPPCTARGGVLSTLGSRDGKVAVTIPKKLDTTKVVTRSGMEPQTEEILIAPHQLSVCYVELKEPVTDVLFRPARNEPVRRFRNGREDVMEHTVQITVTLGNEKSGAELQFAEPGAYQAQFPQDGQIRVTGSSSVTVQDGYGVSVPVEAKRETAIPVGPEEHLTLTTEEGLAYELTFRPKGVGKSDRLGKLPVHLRTAAMRRQVRYDRYHKLWKGVYQNG